MSARNFQWITAILAVGFAPMAVGQVTYRGLDHTALGSATLAVLPNDTLQVSNIGPLGQDGVSVDLTGAQFARGAFADMDPAALSGAQWKAETFSGPMSLALTRFVDVGTQWELFQSFPFLGAVILDVEAYYDGQLVASGTGTGGPLALFAASNWRMSYATEVGGLVRTTIEFDPNAIVNVLGSPGPVNTDRLVISTSLPTVFPTLTRTDITVAGMSGFRVTDGLLGMFGFRHRALGQATLNASGVCPSCTLTLGNIRVGATAGRPTQRGFAGVVRDRHRRRCAGYALWRTGVRGPGGVPARLSRFLGCRRHDSHRRSVFSRGARSSTHRAERRDCGQAGG